MNGRDGSGARPRTASVANEEHGQLDVKTDGMEMVVVVENEEHGQLDVQTDGMDMVVVTGTFV